MKKKSTSQHSPSDEFDLICLIDGKKVRVPCSSRRLGKPLAVFPFKNEPEYIELVEHWGVTHANADPKHLPSVQFCERLYQIKDQLNACLKTLNQPIIEGTYLADNSHMKGCGWIVGFDDNETHRLSHDYYGGNVPAKLRYTGRFL